LAGLVEGMSWEDKISKRAKELPPSGIRRFFDIVKTMKGAISLGIGEPDFVTPWHIRKAAITGIERGHTQYTGNSGLIELRREISAYLKGRFDIEYNPDNELLVTIGASEAIDLALRALLDPGDEVVVPDPSYVAYMPNIFIAGGKAVPVKITAENEFRLTPEALKSVLTPRTKALILPYPNNPTGGIMPRRELEAIADVIRNTDIVVISDEIYAELTYEGKHVSFASLPGMYERTLVVSGFSKAFAMTGWRLGYAAGNKDIIHAMCKIHQYVIMCAPIMSQEAAIEALRSGAETDYEDVRKMLEQYDMRRRIIIDELNDMGLSCFEPRGAFYVFPSIQSTGLTSEAFCERLLRDQMVAVVPGNAFGPSGEGYVRCSYASSISNINEAMKRIRLFLSRL
jgi:aminotransferase